MDYFQMINDVAVAEDYTLVDKIHRGLNAGIERKVLVGRNEPGVQNMHRNMRNIRRTMRNMRRIWRNMRHNIRNTQRKMRNARRNMRNMQHNT